MPTTFAALDDGHAGDAFRSSEVDDLTDRHVGRDGDRIADDAALEFLDARDFGGLPGDGHALVDDADAAFLRHGDGEACLGDGVHGGGHERKIEPDVAREASSQIDFAREDFRVGRDQKNVVERQRFFENSERRGGLGGHAGLYAGDSDG